MLIWIAWGRQNLVSIFINIGFTWLQLLVSFEVKNDIMLLLLHFVGDCIHIINVVDPTVFSLLAKTQTFIQVIFTRLTHPLRLEGICTINDFWFFWTFNPSSALL